MNYYDIVLNTARVIGNVNASKKEVVKVAQRVAGYLGKKLDENLLDKAWKEWNHSNGAKGYKPVYA